MYCLMLHEVKWVIQNGISNLFKRNADFFSNWYGWLIWAYYNNHNLLPRKLFPSSTKRYLFIVQSFILENNFVWTRENRHKKSILDFNVFAKFQKASSCKNIRNLNNKFVTSSAHYNINGINKLSSPFIIDMIEFETIEGSPISFAQVNIFRFLLKQLISIFIITVNM